MPDRQGETLIQLADLVADEYRRRARDRSDRESDWAEIDRMVAMRPKRKISEAGDSKNPERDWMTAIEMPKMAEALAVEDADARRLVFPASTEWFSVFPRRTDAFIQRFEAQSPVLTGSGDGLGVNADAESVEIVVKSTLDQIHRLYGFRQSWDAMLVEASKYGTFAGRWLVGNVPRIWNSWRGPEFAKRKIPMLVPVSIKNLYLDDTVQHVLQEGLVLGPMHIRVYWQRFDDIKAAAKARKQGWVTEHLPKLEDRRREGKKKDHVHLLEAVGDFWIENPDGEREFRENETVTVSLDEGPLVIRRRTNAMPFRPYITGFYQKDDIDSPYGTSPLLKGRPLQEMMSEAANRTIDSAILNTEPPVAWDEQDSKLQADGGPAIMPRAKWSAEFPDKIIAHKIGDPAALLAILQGVIGEWEKLTASSEPRVSGELKSHTTAFASELAASRGVLRTEDFVRGVEEDPLTECLYREYWLIRDTLRSSMPVLVNMRGLRGHIEVSRRILPEHCDFTVHGSRGVIQSRERRQNFVSVSQIVANLTPLIAQLQPDQVPNLGEIVKQLFTEFDIGDADRFTGAPKGALGAAAGGTTVQPNLAAITPALAG